MLVSRLAFASLALALPMATVLTPSPRGRDAEVAIVFPPWTAGAVAVERASAGGRLVRLGRYPFIIIHPDAGGFTGLAARVGAWFVVDASGVGGCPPVSGRRA